MKSLSVSEDTKEEFAVDGIGDEAHNNTHHCPTTIVHFTLLHWGEETLAVVLFHNHLRFFGEHILLAIFVSCYSHVTYCCKSLHII